MPVWKWWVFWVIFDKKIHQIEHEASNTHWDAPIAIGANMRDSM